MPTRVINTHAMITYPIIIISTIYLINYLANFTKINNKIILSFFGIIFLIFFILNHQYNNLNDRFKNIYKNRFEKNYSNFLNNFYLRETEFYDENFWNKINKLDDNFYTIVTPSTEILTYRYAKRPYIIKIKGFDYVSYSPSLLGATFEILKDIYGVNIYAKNLSINDEYIRLQFEKKVIFEWQEIKKNIIQNMLLCQ